MTMHPLPEWVGRYRIESLLGRGGMGVVYKAFDPALDRTVALKTISANNDDHSLLQRLYVEARACGRLRHPNIVTVYDLHELEGTVFIAMEYLEGTNLAEAMRQGALSVAQKLAVVAQVLDALAYAHSQQVVHRDIKPTNVHLLADGTVKLLDFGLARVALGDSMTVTGAVMGTPYYMSPEQLKGQKVDARSDIYSTGVLAYELLTGRRAFDAETITAVMLKVLSEPPPPIDPGLELPPGVDRIVMRAMAKAPDRRYASAGHMRADVLALQTRAAGGAGAGLDRTVVAPPPGVGPAGEGESAEHSDVDTLKGVLGLSSASESPRFRGNTRVEPIQRSDGLPGRPRFIPSGRAIGWAGGILGVLLVAVLAWAMTDATGAPDPSPSTNGRSQPPPDTSAQPRRVEPPPPETGPRSSELEQPPGGITTVDPAPSSKPPMWPGIETPARGSRPLPPRASPPAPVLAATDSVLSKALASRLDALLQAQGRSLPQRARVSLEMTTRPSPFVGVSAITADYVATLQYRGSTRTVPGRVLEFGDATTRDTVIERAATALLPLLGDVSPTR